MASTYNGVASNESWENLRRPQTADDGINVGKTERLVSGIAGAAVIALALRRKRLRGVLFPLGGTLLSRAVTGRCAVNRALGRNTAKADRVSSVARGEGIKVERTITVNRPREEVYHFWRQLENLPRFMDHLESVAVLDEDRSHWVAKAPAGTKVEWDATIQDEIENELIAWRSLPGSDIDNAGSVHFIPAGDGTEVRVVLSYDPPAGRVGAAVAKLLGEEPEQQVEEDLRRFKQVMEAVETPARSRKPAKRG
ncbi:MAG TPA: SRPBCC family protein [Gemmatimonadales bacterium]|nr:SRPBCC family protein [Gemmatimonadales bacterium]